MKEGRERKKEERDGRDGRKTSPEINFWLRPNASVTRCCDSAGASAHESIMSGVRLPVDIRRTKVGGVVVQPAAQWYNVVVDVDADTSRVLLAAFQTLPDRA